MFAHRFLPGGLPEQHRWWAELEALTADADSAARTLAAFQRVDVTAQARQLRVPTLVLHARGDAAVPFEEGRLLASLIPGAVFVPLNSDNHVLLDSEPAWPQFLEALRSFLRSSTAEADDLSIDSAELTPAERDVLRLVAQGLDNSAIASQLGKSEKTVRNQVSSIFDKLGVRTRAEAIVRVHSQRRSSDEGV